MNLKRAVLILFALNLLDALVTVFWVKGGLAPSFGLNPLLGAQFYYFVVGLVIVCLAVLVMRRSNPDLARPFRTHIEYAASGR